MLKVGIVIMTVEVQLQRLGVERRKLGSRAELKNQRAVMSPSHYAPQAAAGRGGRVAFCLFGLNP